MNEGEKRLSNLTEILSFRGFTNKQIDTFKKSAIAELIRKNDRKTQDLIVDLLGFNTIEYLAFIYV